MSQWLLEFAHVDYSYPCACQPEIRGLTLNVPPGKRCGLIGQNGCGKTTFFLLANSLYQARQGTIRWQGIGTASARGFTSPKIDLGRDTEGFMNSTGQPIGAVALWASRLRRKSSYPHPNPSPRTGEGLRSAPPSASMGEGAGG